MYGSYEIPVRVEGEVAITVEEGGEGFVYRREGAGEAVEKLLLAQRRRLLLSPVEPVNLPRSITPLLLVEFSSPVVLEPRARRRIFLKFPVEVGVFVSSGEGHELLDIFSLAAQKYTLYGDVGTGSICRYWRSDVYPSLPEVEPLREGVLELRLENTTSAWVEVGRAVFSAYGMKIYHSGSLAGMRGRMRILGESAAETYFSDSPLLEGMSMAPELFPAGRRSGKFTMEAGL